MDFDGFIGEVQQMARLGTTGEAIAATRATLTTLAERLTNGEAQDLAAQLPRELGRYLEQAVETKDVATGESFTLDEFFDRVAIREDADAGRAAFHARAVLAVLRNAVSSGELEQTLAQLPDSWDTLLNSGSEGELQLDS